MLYLVYGTSSLLLSLNFMAVSVSLTRLFLRLLHRLLLLPDQSHHPRLPQSLPTGLKPTRFTNPSHRRLSFSIKTDPPTITRTVSSQLYRFLFLVLFLIFLLFLSVVRYIKARYTLPVSTGRGHG